MEKIVQNQLPEIITDVLSKSPSPLTSSELRTRLRVRSVNLVEHEVLKVLRELQSKEIVRLERGRWNIRTKSNTGDLHKKTIPEGGQEFRTATLTPGLSAQSKSVWSPGNSQMLKQFNHEEDNNKEKEPLQSIEFSGPWGTFRRLLRYYADCVRNDEGFEALAFLNEIGKKFLLLRQTGRWYPRTEKKWEANIALGPDMQNFIRKVGQLGDSGVLLLGYPLQIWSKENTDIPNGTTVILKPIFTYQINYKFDTGLIKVSCEEPWPEINLDWLSYALKDQNQQREFLSTCGLMNRGKGDEFFGDVGRQLYEPDLQTLAVGVSAYFGQSVREPLRPENVSSVMLSEKPISGIYNRAVLMIGNRTKYAKSLLKELSKISACSDEELDKTALRFIFRLDNEVNDLSKGSSKDGTIIDDLSLHEGMALETCPLNGDQRHAVAALVTKDLTVVTGPPGTGKSQVVGAAMANARLRDQTVLFSSRNHKAIDAVFDRLILSDGNPLIVRANSKEDAFLKFGFEEAITQLLNSEYDHGAGAKWNRLQSKLMELLQRRGEWGVMANKVQTLRDELGDFEQKIATIIQILNSEYSIKVLIKDINADLFPARVVQRLDLFYGSMRRIKEKAGIFTRAIWRIISILFAQYKTRLSCELRTNYPFWPEITLNSDYKSLRMFASQLLPLMLMRDLCDLRIKTKPIEEELKKLPCIDDLVSSIKKASDELERLAPEALGMDFVRRRGLSNEENRESLAALRAALRGLDQPVADDDDRQAVHSDLAEYSPILLKHYPLWAVTNLSIGSRFPLVAELFDLAIIDEASQCDIPSAIPILFRAKRVGIVGDPRQLSHVTHIQGSRDALLRKRHGLKHVNNEQRFAYPDTSLYDLFSQTNGVVPISLKDTYRSNIEIAEYSNSMFYGGMLRVLTAAEKLKIPRNVKPGITWVDVESEIKSAGPHGCFAEREIDSIVNIVKNILINNQFDGTLGIVTPFVQQKIRINDTLTQEIPSDIRRHSNLLVDTAHGFQGDERDVMIMSLCVGPTMPPGSQGFIRQTANLMNVAVSRARAVLYVVGNKGWASKCGIRHIEQLALPAEKARKTTDTMKSPWYPHESPWEQILFNALIEQGIAPEPQYPVFGRRLDLALIKENNKIDIEVDGDRHHRNPDGTRKRDDIWRDIQLQGSGWTVMRFWVYQLRDNLDGCVATIIKKWSNNG